MEGSFYSLLEKLRNHDSKFYNYFRKSIHTFDFLVDRVTNSVLLFFLTLVKKLFFQKYINFSPSILLFYFVFKFNNQQFCLIDRTYSQRVQSK